MTPSAPQLVPAAYDRPCDRPFASAAELFGATAAAEAELAAAVLADPAALVPVAWAVGANPGPWTQPDLLLVYAAAVAARRRGLPAVLTLARHALRAGGHWGRGPGPTFFARRWDDDALAAMALSHYPSREAVRLNARRAVVLWGRVGRLRAASAEWRAALRGGPRAVEAERKGAKVA